MVYIDEAGRGTLTGSLFVCGINVKNDDFHKEIFNKLELKDSKKLSKKKREELAYRIKQCCNYHIVQINNNEIDNLGISACMHKALKEILDYFEEKFNETDFLFDGNTNFGHKKIQTMVKADAKIKEVSAASILAKNAKDIEMEILHEKYPQYNWKRNSGYLTKEHKEKIKEYGLTEYHRKSFKIRL